MGLKEAFSVMAFVSRGKKAASEILPWIIIPLLLLAIFVVYETILNKTGNSFIQEAINKITGG